MNWMSPNDPTYWDECAGCGHYRSEHAPPPDPVCGCDVLSFGEWHICPCPAFSSPSATAADEPASSLVDPKGQEPA